ncbi:MAG: PstS family phosphate ABC transporter substrate-binding protein [Calditrichaeota bacterium]|nr:PstS family phosphate ABC transporter substrate-binding protein [Calditrichota bacterium]MCB9365747.1 PstS family phosphate ABC transporter substrate-binding protein [Calditrichota bacterium]
MKKLALCTLVFAAILALGCGRSETPKEKTAIDIKGSDTMVNLMSSMAENFMKGHAGKNVAVTGGGSGTGIAALLNGTTDICAASRTMLGKEYDLAKQKGLSPQEFVIGMDGLAVFVNPQNTVDSLTLDQIKQIFQGQITDWSQLGGQPGEVVVLSRESNSGTYVYFKEHVLAKGDFVNSARLMTSTAALVQEVSSNANAIGYGGEAYGHDSKVKMLNVRKTADSPAIFPTETTVREGTYPIARPLFLYTNGVPAGLIKEFIDYCNAPEGQRIVREVGYVPLKG